ncbi:MAG: hypothetical protein V2A56_01115 [bacterium]
MEWKQGEVTLIVPKGWERYGIYTMQRGLAHLDSLYCWYHQRPETVRIILNPWQDAGIDFATVQPMRVELTLTPALDKGIRPQGGLFLDLVTAHELTHTVQFSTHAGITRPLRWIFGDAVAPLGISPDWSVEGQAIWTESSGGGGRLHSSWHAQLLRTRLLEGKAWSTAQIAHPGTVAPDANRAYIAGAYLYDDLVQNHGGTEAAAAWMRSRAAWPFVLSVPTRKTYRHGGVDLYRSFLKSWVDKWSENHPHRELQPRGRILAAEPRTDWRRAVWTDGGDLLAVERSYDRPTRLVRLHPSESNLSDPEPVATLGYSPHNGITPFRDGVIVSEYRRGRWASETGYVYLVRIDSSGDHHDLSDPPLRGFAPAWSPIGNRLAYVEKTRGGPHELRIVPLDANGVVNGAPSVVFRTALGVIGEPRWSEDGRRLAFGFDAGEGERVGIWEIGNDSLFQVRIDGAANTMDPVFAGSGSLWLTADPDGILDLFQVDLLAGQVLRRTFTATAAVEPAPGPEGVVVYGHSTSQGLVPVLLTPEEMRSDTASLVSVSMAVSDLQAGDPVLPQERDTSFHRYSPFRHAAPIFWMPMVNRSDEWSLGLTTLGRDPLGLLSWRVTTLQGLDSGIPDLMMTVWWQAWPIEISGQIHRAPALQASSLYDDVDSTFHYDGERWHPVTEGNLTFLLPVRLDGNGYYAEADPWIGWVTRERGLGLGLQPDSFTWTRYRYNGIYTGIQFMRTRAAARDPVSRHAISFSLFGERNLSSAISDLHASLVEARIRWHFPGPVNNTVVALSAAVQQQDYNWIEFSRGGVRPRGYDDADLDPRWIRGGRLARGSAEFHFPLLFPDWGWGMGAWYLERITGLVFAEAGTSWASHTSHRPIASYGGELVARGIGLYQLSGSVRLGFAWRQVDRKISMYLSWSLPLSAITGDRRASVRDDDLTRNR